jgi:dTMP kinase
VFIVLEGIDGAGKTTQTSLLADRLRRCGVDPLVTQEPGTTELGRSIRQIVKGNGKTPLQMVDRAELLLFAAARAQLVEEVIQPALAQGRTVLSDRYIYSTIAYQGAGRGLDLDVIDVINRIATGGVVPDLVLLLDLPGGSARRRQHGRGADRFDEESAAFYERVRASYLGQAAADPARWRVLDGTLPIEHIAEQIWSIVSERLACA